LFQLLLLVVVLWVASYWAIRHLFRVGKSSEAMIHIWIRLPLRLLGAFLIVVGLLAGFYYCMISEARLVFVGAQGPAEATRSYGKAFADVVRKTFGAFGKAFTV